MRKIIAISVTAGAMLAVAPVAYAATASTGCTTVRDHIAKTDTGHGTPAEWADLSLNRTTKVCGDEKAGYTVTLVDAGRLWTRPGAGSPNGTGTPIATRVAGLVAGRYSLTVTGGTLAHRRGNTTASSTDYVRSLFSDDATVTGGSYAWAYKTCREHWLDSSANDDGQGAAAGNITGLRCKPRHSLTPTPTATDSGTPTPSPTDTTAPGEAPKPTPVPTDLPVTG